MATIAASSASAERITTFQQQYAISFDTKLREPVRHADSRKATT